MCVCVYVSTPHAPNRIYAAFGMYCYWISVCNSDKVCRSHEFCKRSSSKCPLNCSSDIAHMLCLYAQWENQHEVWYTLILVNVWCAQNYLKYIGIYQQCGERIFCVFMAKIGIPFRFRIYILKLFDIKETQTLQVAFIGSIECVFCSCEKRSSPHHPIL